MIEYYLSPDKPQVFKDLLHDLGNLHPDKEWVVEISEKKNKRTNPQNALYWKWLSILGDHFGYSKEEMHEEFASRFLGMIERKTMSGKEIREPRSTTSLSKKDFSEYMDMIMAFALSENLTLPQPEHYGMKI